jgi:hypothetical protein
MIQITHAFVYKWTEPSTGKWYIGSRAKKGCHPNDGYLCSSKFVKRLIEANPADWKRDIVLMVSPEDAVPYETGLLQGLNAKHDSMSYNLHNGDGKFSMAGKTGWWKGKPAWNKGKTGIYTSEQLKKLSEKGKLRVGIGPIGATGSSNPRFGKNPWNKGIPCSSDQKKKISETMAGREGKPHSEKTKKRLREQKLGEKNPQYGKKSWNSGLKLGKQSPELIKKRIDAMKAAKLKRLQKEV